MTAHMASFTFKMATFPSSQVSLTKPSSAELTPRVSRPFQVRCKGDSELEASKTLSLTRRDAMLCFTSLFATGIAISSPQIAEARTKKAENRQKIKERLEMLREKMGLSKQKENDKKLPPVPPPSAKKNNDLALEPPPLPLPTPPPNHGKSLVEATVL